MKKHSQIQKVALTMSVTILIILAIIMIDKVTVLQGDARVINYAGITRGNTQRLIKQELRGHENDNLIKTLDSILNELLTAIGNNNLVKLKDDTYHTRLEIQIVAWNNLKKEIYNTRNNPNNSEELYMLSEQYYELADSTVDAAETYSSKTASFIKNIEIIIVIDSVFIILVAFWIFYDLIHMTKLNHNLNDMAYVDILTGLANRSYCEKRMGELGVLQKGIEACCVMLDLNNLKVTNDTLGHQAGDELIKSFAHLIKISAPVKMFVGRYGGDEFIGVAKDITEVEVLEFINILSENVEKQNQKEKVIKISYALGYAMASNYDEITLRELMQQADINMYLRKAEMKQRI